MKIYQREAGETNNKSSRIVESPSDNWPASPLRKEKRRRGGRTRFRNIIVDLATHPG